MGINRQCEHSKQLSRLRVAATKGIPVSVFSLLVESGISMGVLIDLIFVFIIAQTFWGGGLTREEGVAQNKGNDLVWCPCKMMVVIDRTQQSRNLKAKYWRTT